MLIVINKLLWGVLTIFLIYIGLKYTIKLGYPQLNLKKILKNSLVDKNLIKTLCLSLAGRIGVGSIAGIALAIYIGGPGTIFWLWISTFIVAPISYLEAYLATKYKIKKNKEFIGGPSTYIERGLKIKSLPIMYAFLTILVYIAGLLTIQSNSISKLLSSITNINQLYIGIVLSIVTLIVIIKGIKEISAITLFIIPLMALIYILIGFTVFINNIELIPGIILTVITKGLDVRCFLSGFIPTLIIGIERGLFSTEAGIGIAAIAVGSSENNNLKQQGYTQIIGTYFIGLLICTITAIIILTSNYQSLTIVNINGIELAGYAFNYHFGTYGPCLLFIITFFFCFSTIITGYYFGENSLKYIFPHISKKSIFLLKIITVLLLIYGSVANSLFLWISVDIMLAILGIINIYAVNKLSNKAILKEDV